MKRNTILSNQGICMQPVCKHSTSSLTLIKAAIFTLKCAMRYLPFRSPAGIAGEILAEKPNAVPWSHNGVIRSQTMLQGGIPVFLRKHFPWKLIRNGILGFFYKDQINLQSSSLNISLFKIIEVQNWLINVIKSMDQCFLGSSYQSSQSVAFTNCFT